MQISTQLLVENAVAFPNSTYASGRLPTMMNGQLYPPKTSYQDTLAPYITTTTLAKPKPCERAKERKSQSHQPTKADRPMPVPTISVLTNDPPWKQGRHTHVSLPRHDDADGNTIAPITNISPTLPIPRKPPDPAQLRQEPFPRANARSSRNTLHTLPTTERTTLQAAEQTPQSEQHNMTDTAVHCTTLDDKQVYSFSLDLPRVTPDKTPRIYPPTIPSQTTATRCSNSALQDSPRQQDTKNSSRRHLLQGVAGDTEQDNSKTSWGRNEHVDQTTPKTNSAQWQILESFRGDPPREWPEPTALSLQCGKPGLKEQPTAQILSQEAQRNQQVNTPSQDSMRRVAQATGRIPKTLSTRGFSWKQGFLAKKTTTRDQATQSTTGTSALKDTQCYAVPGGPTPILERKQELAASHNGPSSQKQNGRDRNPYYYQRYDLRIRLQQKQQVLSEWEAFQQFLEKLHEIDPTITMYPWSEETTGALPIPLSDAQSGFYALDKYVPRLVKYSWPANPTRHPYLFLASSLPPAQLVAQLGPWLRTTQQGMWPRQLPLAERTKCLGWLLFSAPEYNLEELRHAIHQMTGVEVALRYRHIQDDLPNTATRLRPRAKAIHVEVKYEEPYTRCQRIRSAFAPQATVFPSGIKMRLVEEMQNLTNPAARSTASQIHDLQEIFLAHSKTGLFPIQPHLVDQQDKIYATLRQFLSTQLDPTEAVQKPFYAVSAMVKKVGFIIRYLPQHHDSAQKVMTRILATFPGAPAETYQPVSHTSQAPSVPPKVTGSELVSHQQSEAPNSAIAQLQLQSNIRTTQIPRPKCTLSNDVSKPRQQHECPRAQTTSPSHNDKYRWLVAVLTYFQNTAWDKWRYCNGIQDRGWRKPNLPVGLE